MLKKRFIIERLITTIMYVLANMILCLILCLILVPCAQGLNINEVMYNPIGDDNNKEFIEIFGTDNLSGYTIGDSSSNDSLVLLSYFPGSYSLIVEEGFNHSSLNCSVYSAGSTIGNNLNNDVDQIYLYSNGTIIDSMSYDGSLANSDDHSLELIISQTNQSWQESCSVGGSPCLPNCVLAINETANETINVTINETMNETINQTINITINETTNTSINITVNVTINVTINETMNVSMNETMNNTINISINETGPAINETTNATVNVTINTSINITTNASINSTSNTSSDSNITNATEPLANLCSVSINITTDKIIYENGEAMEFTIMLSNKSREFIIEYWIEDLFGSEIKARRNTSLLTKKSFTPKIDDKDKVMVAKAKLIYVDCNNSNPAQESGSLFIVKFSEWQPTEEKKCSCPSCSSSSKTTTSSTGTASSTSKAGSTSSTELMKIPESKKETAKIVSFYTRTKKWRDNITLYANVELGKYVRAEELELLLISDLEEQKLGINSSGTISLDAKAGPGRNIFTLNLLDEGIIIDTRMLEANLSIEEKEVLAEKSSFAGPNAPDEQSVQNSTKATDPLTGKVVYESSNKRLTGYAPYILVFVMLIVIIALSLLRKK